MCTYDILVLYAPLLTITWTISKSTENATFQYNFGSYVSETVRYQDCESSVNIVSVTVRYRVKCK